MSSRPAPLRLMASGLIDAALWALPPAALLRIGIALLDKTDVHDGLALMILFVVALVVAGGLCALLWLTGVFVQALVLGTRQQTVGMAAVHVFFHRTDGDRLPGWRGLLRGAGLLGAPILTALVMLQTVQPLAHSGPWHPSGLEVLAGVDALWLLLGYLPVLRGRTITLVDALLGTAAVTRVAPPR